MQRDAVFIVGLYKNGTSWLLAALAAHPQFTALREIDLLSSAARGESRIKLYSPRKRLANVFGRSAFSALLADQLAPRAYRAYMSDSHLARSATSVFDLPPPLAVETISAMSLDANGRSQINQSNDIEHLNTEKPLSFIDIPFALRTELFISIRDAKSTEEVLNKFIETMSRCMPHKNRLVMKGADQIVSLHSLVKILPRAQKIVIVRDGRDAAVSAYFYRDLMRQRHAAWQHSYASYWAPVVLVRETLTFTLIRIRNLFGYGNDWRFARSMRVWRERVRRVLYWAERDELYVIRYEDLIADFHGTLTKLLTWLGVDASVELVAKIEKACSFEAMTGRPRGVAKPDPIRRGITREWVSALTLRDRKLAWRIAGAELSLLGYGRDGHLSPLHIGSKPK